jgi:hypothetical protein
MTDTILPNISNDLFIKGDPSFSFDIKKRQDGTNEITIYHKWISVKDRLPTEKGDILILIAGKIFVGVAVERLEGFYYAYPDIYEYILPRFSFSGNIQLNGEWSLPSHFKEPSHWLSVPEAPK